MNYRKRYIEPTLLEALKNFRGVFLFGPRQSGKTILSKHIAEILKINYLSFDEAEILNTAKNYPESFFDLFPLPLVIDEVQKAPEIIPQLKIQLDKNPSRGQVLLTGSADFRKIKPIRESLVGRLIGIKLYPYSTAEIFSRKNSLLKQLFEGQKTNTVYNTHLTDLLNFITRGFFPEIVEYDIKDKNLSLWYDDYINNHIIKDLDAIETIRNKQKFINFVYALAWQTAGLINVSNLSRQTGLSRPTVEKYLSLLQELFITEYLRPFYDNTSKRFVKQPKLFFTDTGLLTHLLQTSAQSLILNHNLMGKIFENWIYTELAKEISYRPSEYKLFFVRDDQKQEIDFLVENKHNELIAIEVKAKTNIRNQDLKSINTLSKKLNFRHIYIFYLGDYWLPKKINDKTLWCIPAGFLMEKNIYML